MKSEVVIAAISVLIAVVSLFISVALALKQGKLEERLKRRDEAFERRRFITSLWNTMSSVDNINPQQPIAVSVRKAMNALELVAICWNADVVDKHMVVLAFGQTFVSITFQIQQIGQVIPGINMTGIQLLAAHPAVQACRDEIIAFQNQHVQIGPVP